MSYSLSSVLRRGIRSTIRSRFSQDLKKNTTPSLHVRRYQNNGGSLSKVEGALRLFEMDTDPLRAKEQLLLASEEENLPPQTYAEVCYALGCLFEAHSDLLDEEDLGDGVPRPDPAAARAVLLEVRELRREARRGRRAQRRRQEGEQGPAALGQVHRVGGWRAPAAAAAAGGAEGGGGGGGGGGVSVECEEAWGWHLRAAERGHIGAMVRLGHMCLPGAEDTPENSRQLLKWYMAAATAAPLPSPPPPPPPPPGGPPSAVALAAEGGAGGGGEGGEAAWWWEEQWREVLRANGGGGGGGGGDDDGGDGQGESGGGGKGSPQAEALYGLGAAHEQGVLGGGAPPDPALARRFYLWAGALGAPSAAYLAGHRLLHHRHGEEGGEGEGDGDGGPSRGAAELGLGLVESAARQGHAGAQGHLAALCRAGHGRAGLAPDPARFRFWAQKAASAGDPFSQAMMGDAHFHGLDGVQRDLPKAFRYYEAAANQGHAEACYSVGVMLYHGFGVEQSYEDSFRYYQYAAERGAARAWRNLAAMHAQGLGVPRSEDTARHILKVMGDAIRQADQEEEEKAGSNGF